MERQTFLAYNCDLTTLHKSMETYFVGKCYRANNFFKENLYLTQAYKKQLGNNVIVAQIQGAPENFDISIGYSQKINNINAIQPFEKIPFNTKVILGEPLLEKNFMNYIATQAELKRNTFGMGISNSTPPFLAPVWKEREVIREIEVVYCRYCGTKNNARQTNCVKCSASLH